MKTKKYKVLKGYYNEVKETEIEIPENAILISDSYIYDTLHVGHYNYLGAVWYKDWDGDFSSAINDVMYHIADIMFLVFRDVKPIDEIPTVSIDEFNAHFKTNELFTTVYRKKEPWADDDSLVVEAIFKIRGILGPYRVFGIELTLLHLVLYKEEFCLSKFDRLNIRHLKYQLKREVVTERFPNGEYDVFKYYINEFLSKELNYR